MGFHGHLLGTCTSAFFCFLSEVQKGAEDKGQIKAQSGGIAMIMSCITSLRPIGGRPLNQSLSMQAGAWGYVVLMDSDVAKADPVHIIGYAIGSEIVGQYIYDGFIKPLWWGSSTKI